MRRIGVNIVFLTVIAANCHGQLVLERQVISCFALNMEQNDTTLFATAGQVEFTTVASSQNILTQGFEQPRNYTPVEVEISVFLNQCNDLYEVQINSITNCGELSGAQIFWNGTPSDTLQEYLPTISTLEIIGSTGCIYSGVYNFENLNPISLICELQIYNYISPNGDNSNETWWIENIDNDVFAVNEVKIFNRWGGLVWSTNDYNNADKVWTGKSSAGENLPDGTYYYSLELNDRNLSGFVELMR